MFDVPTFLMRWLFLSNLMRDVAEIQTLPFQPYYPPPNLPHPVSQQQLEELWRDHCLRGILSYPPGSQRLMVMDSMRVELVQQLAQNLCRSDQILQTASYLKRKTIRPTDDDTVSDPYYAADTDIIRTFQENSNNEDEESNKQNLEELEKERQARLVISDDGTNIIDSDEDATDTLVTSDETPTPEQIMAAARTRTNIREYLPQLVAAVLKSPSAFNPSLVNPISRLRRLILNRCMQDPSWGIELCWLLEAEVGRAWKTLFEHRQQTGRRLIVVLPAEKAAVLAKIGTEKRETFDLLQDAEQATAYGYTVDYDREEDACEAEHHHSRLPSSLSLRRCSHFGDTMHFIDRLTKISMDLRNLPVVERNGYLHDHLYEMNRRIRRRMVTRGDVSLDVEDNRTPYDWPQINDLTLDALKYSVHFPLVPQTGNWPTGNETFIIKEPLPPSTEVVRILNIVVPETRILASRERCPYLVHLEVVDSGLEGSDPRLYASGVNEIESTIEEALSMSASASAAAASSRHKAMHEPSYRISPELLPDRFQSQQEKVPSDNVLDDEDRDLTRDRIFPRGGYQTDQTFFHDDTAGYYFSNPYDAVRQEEYEQLHQQMQYQQQGELPVQSNPLEERPTVSVGKELLDNVFGQPWNEKCKEIRQLSPFGHIRGWRLASFIMKAGEDIRREALVMQIISKLRGWFQDELPDEHRPYMRPYTIMCVGGDAGLLECLSDAKSVDEVKKRTDSFSSLRDFFERAYGPPNPMRSGRGYAPPVSMPSREITFETAQDNFLRSLVGYSLVCYILQVKDRHNANILMDREGHIMHIDFGFVLGDTPKMGKVPIFSERAPFKLSGEFWDVLGGWNINEGGLGVRFCKMFELAFACAAAHADEIACLVEATMLALNNDAQSARMIANGVRSRLRMRGPPNSFQQKSFVMDLVNAALTSWGTSTYDWLQRNMNGYQ